MGALPVMNSSGWLYCNRSSHPGCVEHLNRILRHFRATYNETDTRVNTVTFSHCKGVRSHSIGTQSYNKKSTRTLTLIMRVTAVTVSTHTHRNTCKQSKINMFGFWCLLVQMVSCSNRTCVRAHTDKNKKCSNKLWCVHWYSVYMFFLIPACTQKQTASRVLNPAHTNALSPGLSAL